MDAGDEADLSIQKTAASSIRELEHSIPLLLFKTPKIATAGGEDGGRTLRHAIREDGLNRLVHMLSPFQEMPQLLDPSLENLAGPLSSALIQCLSQSQIDTATTKTKATSPSFATCKLLYTLCQIRGHKVIVRFLSNEAKYLKPLVESLETSLGTPTATGEDALKWEEKYVLLLWLSHLVLTPFPLLSSLKAPRPLLVDASLVLPPELHLVSRTCSLALSQLASSSRERDAAVLVLVHLVMRPDMVEPRLMPQLLDLVQRKLDASITQSSPHRTHEVIGSLALLAGIFNSAGAQLVSPYIEKVSHFTLRLLQVNDAQSLAASAVTRKLIIKIQRCSALAALALSPSGSLSTPGYEELVDELMEDIIEQLLNCLGDPDTPVRYAASKALSVITLKLDSEMGNEVTEAVLEGLNEDVLWTTDESSTQFASFGSLSKARDLSLVSPLRWQGLMLTLSQLLFRKAPSQEALPAVISSLLLGLTFEQRTASGVSVGGPVRDAANFGIWALSRQYTTAELNAVEASSVQSIAGAAENVSLLQILACELVCAACLDPSGNIRRGSSAALQELIGRHPDTIKEGIGIVQTVDYHAVALRSSALTKVTSAAAQLSEVYRTSLLAGTLGWRGVNSTDAESRRWAANASGQLARVSQLLATQTLLKIRQIMEALQPREVEARHGLTLAAEQVITTIYNADFQPADLDISAQLQKQTGAFWDIYDELDTKSLTNPILRPSLTCEAIFRLLTSLSDLSSVLVAKIPAPKNGTIQKCTELIELCAPVREDISMDEIARAAQRLFESGLLTPETQFAIAERWVQNSNRAARSGEGKQAESRGWIVILSHVHQQLSDDLKRQAADVLIFAMTIRVGVEVRVAALRALQHVYERSATSTPKQYMSVEVASAIVKCLGDFTTDQRGDVGSLIRVAALRCASKMSPTWLKENKAVAWTILATACGLAVEKLDRVRTAAWPCVVSIANTLPLRLDEGLQIEDDISSTEHFLRILTLAMSEAEYLLVPTLLGLITSVGNGPETVLRAARQAIQLLLVTAEPQVTLQLLQALMSALAVNLDDERLAPQALITMAFLFETGTLNRHKSSSDAAPLIRELFALVQKAHFKSTSIPRLTAAVDIYTSLVAFTCVHTSALKKLLTMLAHPFPLVRRRAAEGLYCVTNVGTILTTDWSRPPSQLKSETSQLKEAVLAS